MIGTECIYITSDRSYTNFLTPILASFLADRRRRVACDLLKLTKNLKPKKRTLVKNIFNEVSTNATQMYFIKLS